MPRLFSLMLTIASLINLLVDQSAAQDTQAPAEPSIVGASDEGQTALQGFRTSAGLVGSLFAAEPLVANPVVFYVDSQSRVFVCESFRQEKGVTDNRGHSEEWLDADLASQTVADRRKYHEAQLGDDLKNYITQDDRIRLLLDTNDDGVADESHVFADRFNDLVEGTGAGVLELNGDVYYTCIPNLWRMRDHDGDFKADSREALHTGYGVRVAFRGHDLHGLRLGPDGRIYFSIGDRGANVQTPNGRVKNTHSGSVFRCEQDGSNLEIFATGLRNPQELAFDDFGNLFTGDNNSDSGDRARWVYVVEGGDSGWRMAYQYLRDRGPFNREKIWHPFHEGQPAYIVPPVANFADGPSGLDYYPGTGFSDDLQGRFVMADFRGTPARSGIRSFRVEPDGAFFKLADDDEELIWGVLATDVQFGPDGSLYVSDWVNGWNGEGKGRIYRFVSPEHQRDPIVAQVKALLAESFSEKKSDDIVALLSHADQRIRLKAQFALASGRESAALAKSAASNANLFARLHAMWGLEQIERVDDSTRTNTRDLFRTLLDDSDAEVRAHAARLLGEVGQSDERTIQALRKCMADENQRVRYFAALSIGKLKATEALADVVDMLDANDNLDPIVRHGGVMALSQIADEDTLANLTSHKSVAVRLAAVVALRRQASSQVAAFLQDGTASVVLEAARAIHDVPIAEAMPQLATLLSQVDADDALLRRVLNANFRMGGARHAQALANFASTKNAPTSLRLAALEMLADWKSPNSRDRVLGMWRPLQDRDPASVVAALRPVIAEMADSDPALRLAAARVGADLHIAEAAPVLSSLIADDSMQASQRADALRSLAKMTGKESLPAIQAAVKAESPEMRAAGLELMATLDPAAAAPLLEKAAMEGEQLERQVAIMTLGQLDSAAADTSLVKLLQQLVNDELAPEVQLETLTAARGREAAEITSLLAAYDAKLDSSVPLDQFRETLHGGDSARGRQIFAEKTSVGCVRCHKVSFRGGGEVGPDLSRIAADKNREYLLEAIVDPNRTISKGFESVMILDEDGNSHVGVLKEETDTEVTIMDANANSITIQKATIELRKPSPSAMPEDMVKQLTKFELRDLVEYLSSLDGSRRRRGFNRNRVQ